MAMQIQGMSLEDDDAEAYGAGAEELLAGFAFAMPAGPAAELLPHLVPVLDQMLAQPTEVVRQQVYSCLLQDPRAPFDADIIGQGNMLMAVLESMQDLSDGAQYRRPRLPIRA